MRVQYGNNITSNIKKYKLNIEGMYIELLDNLADAISEATGIQIHVT